MASIAHDPGGQRRILFVAPDGKRQTVRLGKTSQRAAEGVKYRIEQLLAAKLTGHAVESDTARWIAELDAKLAERLARVGLIPKRERAGAATLGAFLESYFERRSDVKASTILRATQARRGLLTYFGPDRALSSITAGDAADWERWLKTGDARQNRYDGREADEGLAVNTIRKRISDAKQFFQDAVSRELLPRNPFAGLKGTVGSNRTRDHFITREQADKVLDACPDSQWRLLFALSRFGGLRCPSEHLALTWANVDWERERICIPSPKTEHHEGQGSRWIPLFPELRPHLEAVWDEAEPGTEYVVTRYRDCNANLRQQLGRIIRKAGLEQWPKLFQNLRASRATELAAEYPSHVAAA